MTAGRRERRAWRGRRDVVFRRTLHRIALLCADFEMKALIAYFGLLLSLHSFEPLWAQPVENAVAVPTFECIGLYWKAPGGSAGQPCEARYRISGTTEWKPGLPLWFDARHQEYRGSLVHLQPGTGYEVELALKGSQTRARLQTRTWSESFPVGKTIACAADSNQTLTIAESGTPEGYTLCEPAGKEGATIDVANAADHCIVVKASHVIIRGLTLKGARIHGILLGPGAHDVVIENCDISGWGRVDKDGWGIDYDSAIYSRDPGVKRVIVQRNRIHHPRSNSNNWQEPRPRPGKRESSHPEGPQAVCLWDSEGNHVIRYNTVYSDDAHQYNDIFGAGHNFSERGFPNRDSDIYGNLLSHCWDDAIESEGANCNVRIWGNYVTDAFVGIACASTATGPLYVWRNVTGTIRESPTKIAGAFLKTSNRTGGGRIYVFHNTLLQPPSAADPTKLSGAVVGLGWGGPMTNVMSRNNILHVTRQVIVDRARDPLSDHDYDLFSMPVNVGDRHEQHGILGVPVYVTGHGLKDGKGDFALSSQSPGIDAGVVLPNFNDGFLGADPDVGAHEAGSAPMQFGVTAYPKAAPRAETGTGDFLPSKASVPSPQSSANRNDANFTTGSSQACRFGTHEIVLRGTSGVPNPFDTAVTVQFTPPSGPANAVTVDAFYDGEDIWRARVYVSETGVWHWTSSSVSDSLLNGKSGSFVAVQSELRGMLRKHSRNPRAWMTEDGRWFSNISDTGYRLFHSQDAPLWQRFIKDAADKGINCMRAAALGGWGGTPDARVDDNNTWVWNDPWAGGANPDYARFDLAKFQNTDSRLIWIFNHYPGMYLQFILFSFKGYGTEGTGNHWASLPIEVRTRTMRYFLARWSAFPNLFWLIVNDMHCDERFPKNQAFVREIGHFFAANDPWQHLLSTGPNRRAGFPFTTPEDLKWCSYVHIEDANTVGADAIRQHGLDQVPLHVFMGEDYYEQDRGYYDDPRYFFRWLFWSWLLSGGSANYCGRWGAIHPYSVTGDPRYEWQGIDRKTTHTGKQLAGLDSIPFLASYFEERQLDLGLFEPDDESVTDLDGRTGRLRPKLMRRGLSEFLVYHPNAAADGKAAKVDTGKTARMRVDLTRAPRAFEVEWFRAFDGVAATGGTVQGGGEREFRAPWKGHDVVLRLRQAGGTASAAGQTGATVLGIQDTRFTLNGRPTFLLGISYYGGLGAAEESIRRDLDDLQRSGFNWLRVWATWAAFDHDVSAVNERGEPREPFLGKLQWLVAECNRRGVVVDVTLTRHQRASRRDGDAGLPDFDSHRRAVETLVGALKGHRNWYLDLANERDVRDARYVSLEELKALRELVRRLDPGRLVTASFGGHDLRESDVRDSLVTAGHDFLTPHRPRDPKSPTQTELHTRACLGFAKALQRVAPVHYQEPFRRGYTGGWEPAASDFLADLRGAIAGGAAGWCFHNGSQREAPDNQPRRSFDLRKKRLMDQLDPEELKVVKEAKAVLVGTPWSH